MKLKKGDVVEVLITDLVVDDWENSSGRVHLFKAIDGKRNKVSVLMDADMIDDCVTVTKAAFPEEWPPQSGDVWVDDDGDAAKYVDGELRYGPGMGGQANEIWETFGPLRLIYRKPE